VSADAFWDDVERHVVRYGAAFTPRIIESAAGCYVHDSDGRAILDFTSGQMSAVREAGRTAHRSAAAAARDYEVVGDVRGRGLLQGIELVKDKESKTPADALGRAVTAACLERGLHLNIVQLPGMGGTFRIAPPLTTSDDELHAGIDILDASLEAVLHG
jgi:4-aminobutyrate aminotransferase-like enzyme